MNSVQITGNLTKDPNCRFTTAGTPVASFRMAVHRKAAEEKEYTDFITITAWDELAEAVSETLKKGMYVKVDGRLATRTYESPSGEKHYVTEVVAGSISIPISKKGKKEKEAESGADKEKEEKYELPQVPEPPKEDDEPETPEAETAEQPESSGYGI